MFIFSSRLFRLNAEKCSGNWGWSRVNFLRSQWVNTGSKQKTKEKKKVRTLHKHTGLKQKKVTCPAGCPCPGSQHPRDLCLLFVKKKRINYSSEGQYLKEAHFFLKKAILLLSRAICFSISMEFLISCIYTCNVGRVFLILQVYI